MNMNWMTLSFIKCCRWFSWSWAKVCPKPRRLWNKCLEIFVSPIFNCNEWFSIKVLFYVRYTRDPWQVWIVGTMDCCNNELKYQGRSLKNSMWEWNRAHQESKCKNCRKLKKKPVGTFPGVKANWGKETELTML